MKNNTDNQTNNNMSKTTTFLLTLLFVAFQIPAKVSAAPITMEDAQTKAETYLAKCKGSKKLKPIINTRKLAPGKRTAQSAENSTPYYVFNRGENEGYVIVAADDLIEGVMGYTDKGEFDYHKIPDNMRAWLNEFAEFIEYVQKNPDSAPKKLKNHPAISPMMKTLWDQGHPYNVLCPANCPTGCVATALAQVLYFQHEKSVAETQDTIHGYTTGSGYELKTIPKGTPIDWDNMKRSYGSNATEKEIQAVAQLMLMCGVALQMEYTPSGSGAAVALCPDVMNKYFGYSQAKLVGKSYYTDEDWDALMYNELCEGRVVLLGGWNSGGGHAFVCDGYDGYLCYHINWGWGGQSDGHFLMNYLNPSSQGIGGTGDGYSQGLCAIINAVPDNFEEKPMAFADAAVRDICLSNFDANGDGVLTYGEAAAVSSLGDVFKGQQFSTFTELYYFTGVKQIPAHAFEENTQLTDISMPKGLLEIGDYAFSGCTLLRNIRCFDEITDIGNGAFSGCKSLPQFDLPKLVTAIKDYTFSGCSSISSFTLPRNVTAIGTRAFDGCTDLYSFTVNTTEPEKIILGEEVFANINLEYAILNIMQGTDDFFANAEQWKEFGNIHQERTLANEFCDLATDKLLLLYNVGTAKYLSKGEEWTMRATTDKTPLKFRLRRTADMPDDTYYVEFDDYDVFVGTLFHSDQESYEFNGIKTVFVDGDDEKVADKSAWWIIKKDDNGFYTFQPPQDSSDYEPGQYMGVMPSRTCSNREFNYGVYYDVDYNEAPANCQWRFIAYDETTTEQYIQAEILSKLISLAENAWIDYSDEKLVYDYINSTLEELIRAQKRLRKKLKLIHFEDAVARAVAPITLDQDMDGEVSYDEAQNTNYISLLLSGTDVRTFDELKYFTAVTEIFDFSFKGCALLEKITLPDYIYYIGTEAFNGCSSLESIDLPVVTDLGAKAFAGCTSLKTFSINVNDPGKISMGDNVFEGVDQGNATLIVPQGSKELFAEAAQWKEFGNIIEMRASKEPLITSFTVNENCYLMNICEHRYITKGEAWGTQAVVGLEGMVYQIKREPYMPDGQYYLYSDETGRDGKVLFRTVEDQTVGIGVTACFVDGELTRDAYWQLIETDGPYFKLAVPEGCDGAGSLLGVNTSHETGYTSTTYGLYWDFSSDDTSEGVLWGFVYEENKQIADNYNNIIRQLRDLLKEAEKRGIDKVEEQAVYDKFESTLDELTAALKSLRKKMGYIDFADSRIKAICMDGWDEVDDDEFTEDEAIQVVDLGWSFKGNSAIKSFEELRYFKGLTDIPDEEFRGCSSLTSIYLPETVTKIGEKAFSGCTQLLYVALLAPQVVEAQGSGLMSSATIFVPEELVEAYQADATWKKHKIKPFTGTPIVKAEDVSRIYGATTSSFSYTVEGAPINGTPLIVCEQDATTPVDEYEIVCLPGSITSPNLICQNGVFTVTPARLTVSAKSYTRNVGEPNPEFAVSYRGWKNKENTDVFTSPVVITCEATINSPAGTYDIIPSGIVAQNYEINYVNGTLTVVGKPGDVNCDGETDISDIVAIINHIAGTARFSSADVNNDKAVDISDIVAVINIIAGK